METYIHNLVKDIKKNKDIDISNTTFVLPNRRSILFFKKEIHRSLDESIWSPKFFSLDDFINDISGLKVLKYSDLEIQLYNTCFLDSKYSFKKFCSLSRKIINDFNDIDFQLQDAKSIFNYLKDAEEIKKIGIDENSGRENLINKFISFYSTLYDKYLKFNEHLLSKNLAYKGLSYKKALENIEDYIGENPHKKIIFVGLNALNNCEESIIQKLVRSNLALTYWDCDKYFIDKPNHEAAYFIKRYIRDKKLYVGEFKWVFDSYKYPKKVNIFNTSSNMEQAKYIVNILRKLYDEDKRVVVVLPEDKLLIPILSSITDDIDISKINITMQLSLKVTDIYMFIDAFFKLYINAIKVRGKNSFYYKDILSFVNSKEYYDFDRLKNTMQGEFVLAHQLLNVSNGLAEFKFIKTFFHDDLDTDGFVDIIFEFLNRQKNNNRKLNKLKSLESKTINNFENIFDKIKDVLREYDFINTIGDIYHIFNNELESQKISLVGDPLSKIQFCGLFETRLLDFDSVIFTSMSENVMPPSKGYDSFVPYDLRLNKNLFTNKYKTAIYSYHFYRLLQRAESIFLLYARSASIEKNEMSRYILQMKQDKNNFEIQDKNIYSQFSIPKDLNIKIEKNDALKKIINDKLKNKISVSELINFVSSPLKFYFNNLLNIDDRKISNQLTPDKIGAIIHDSIRDIYQLFMDTNAKDISELKKDVIPILSKNIKDYNVEYDRGKNMIVFDVCKRYINILLDYDRKESLNIKELEGYVEHVDASKNIYIKGKIDRVHVTEGITEILDYKTSKVEKLWLKFNSLADIIDKLIPNKNRTYGLSYGFQLMCYGYMYMMNNPQIDKIKLSIFSFVSPYKKIFLSIDNTEEISRSMFEYFEEQLKSIFDKIVDENYVFEGVVDL